MQTITYKISRLFLFAIVVPLAAALVSINGLIASAYQNPVFRHNFHDESRRLEPLRANSGTSMRVLWRISEYKVGEGAVWGEEDARGMLFKPLDIDTEKARITFDGRTCRDVIFDTKTVHAREYLEHVYQSASRAAGIDDETIEVVKTNCDLPGFAEYIRLKDKRLVIQIKGVFFFFEPALNY